VPGIARSAPHFDPRRLPLKRTLDAVDAEANLAQFGEKVKLDARPNVDNADDRAVAEPNTVLLGLVGSTVHGVTVDDADDRDEMGIRIQLPEYVAGLRRFGQWFYRTQHRPLRRRPTAKLRGAAR
jgi:hypothetical protein